MNKFHKTLFSFICIILTVVTLNAQCNINDCGSDATATGTISWDNPSQQLTVSNLSIGNISCPSGFIGLYLYVYQILPDGTRMNLCDVDASPDNTILNFPIVESGGVDFCGGSQPLPDVTLTDQTEFNLCDGGTYEVTLVVYVSNSGQLSNTQTAFSQLGANQLLEVSLGNFDVNYTAEFPVGPVPLITNTITGPNGETGSMTVPCGTDVFLDVVGLSRLANCRDNSGNFGDIAFGVASEVENFLSFTVNGGTPVVIRDGNSGNATEAFGGQLSGPGTSGLPANLCYAGLLGTLSNPIPAPTDGCEGDVVVVTLTTNDIFVPALSETTTFTINYSGANCSPCVDCPTGITITDPGDQCNGDIVNMTASVSGPNAGTITWTDGSNNPVDPNNFSFVNTTCDVVTYTFNVSVGCDGDPSAPLQTDQLVVDVYPSDISSFISSSNNGCTSTITVDASCGNNVSVSASSQTANPGDGTGTHSFTATWSGTGSQCVNPVNITENFDCPCLFDNSLASVEAIQEIDNGSITPQDGICFGNEIEYRALYNGAEIDLTGGGIDGGTDGIFIVFTEPVDFNDIQASSSDQILLTNETTIINDGSVIPPGDTYYIYYVQTEDITDPLGDNSNCRFVSQGFLQVDFLEIITASANTCTGIGSNAVTITVAGGNLGATETLANLTDAGSNISNYVSSTTVGSNKEYTFNTLPDGTYTFNYVDASGCDLSTTLTFNCNVTTFDCPTNVDATADPSVACAGDAIVLSETISNVSATTTIEWTDENGNVVDPFNIIAPAVSSCDPQTFTYTVSIDCTDDPGFVPLTDQVTITVYPTDISSFVSAPANAGCSVTAEIDASCSNVSSTTESFGPGESGTTTLTISYDAGPSCITPFTINANYNCADILGCTDNTACNFNPAATADDGSCNAPDCAGDCTGNQTGPATTDLCGVCDADASNDNQTCLDCEGVPNGTAVAGTACDDGDPNTGNDVYDANCDCVGSTTDCLGIPGGPNTLDACGVCDDDPANDNQTCADCAGVPNGPNTEDACGVCDADASNDNQTCADCAGVPNGPNTEDLCGVCDADASNDNTTCLDCAGVPNGPNTVDLCGVCDADASNDNTTCLDCEGVPNGPAVAGTSCDDGDPNTSNDTYDSNCNCIGSTVDCLGIPGGPNTLDACGVCDDDPANDNQTCADCAGIPNGPNTEDACGVCDADASNDNQTCADCAGVPNGPNTEDLCGVCDADASNDNTTCLDCAGIPNGPNTVDLCGVCDADASNDNTTCLDCEGVPNGPAVAGTSCDDGDPNTSNDTYDSNCNCIGSTVDCLGIPGGPNTLDACGVCDDDPANDNQTCADCAGIPNGPNTLDACGVCDADATNDNQTCADCAGVPNGPNTLDACGVCDDDPANDNVTCADCAGIPNGPNTEDLCGVCDADASNDNTTCLDCAGIPNGPNTEDLCGVCDDDASNDNTTCLDCEGVVNGPATPGTSCDDGDPNTNDEIYDNSCNCVTGAIAGCTDNTACNFDPDATVDNGSCLELDCNGDCGGSAGEGDTCDDGDPLTGNDQFDADCNCIGTPVCPTLFTSSVSSNEICRGDDITFTAVLDPSDAANALLEVTNMGGNLMTTLEDNDGDGVFEGTFTPGGNNCAVVTRTFTLTVVCLDDQSTVAVQTEDVTIYPTNLDQYISTELLDDGCTVSVSIDPDCTGQDGTELLTIDGPSTQGPANAGDSGTYQFCFEYFSNSSPGCFDAQFCRDYAYDCPAPVCDNNGGTFPNAVTFVCAGELVNTPAAGVNVSAGYTLLYILHDGVNPFNGNVYGLSLTGAFDNNGQYPSNVDLCISAVVGLTDGTSIPDENDPCTAVSSNCAPVVFLDPVIIDSYTDCNEATGDYLVEFIITGGGPGFAPDVHTFTVTGDYAASNIEAGIPYTFGPLTDGSSYTITVDEDGKGCSSTFVSQPVQCDKLPVELIEFTGSVQADGNLLKWITATEIENDYFTLQSSLDGVDFTTITTIDGAGTTSSIVAYEELDRNAQSGTTYYKLFQTDFDGTTVEVGMISLVRGEALVGFISLQPVPVQDELLLSFESETEKEVQIEVYDAVGKMLLSRNTIFVAGINNEGLDVRKLTSGIYFIRISSGDQYHTEKFVKE